MTEVLHRFARPQHPEKSLAELERLLDRIHNSEPRPARAPRIRAVTAELQLGPDRIEVLLAQYKAGGSAHAIAREFGVSAAAVMRLVRKRGLEIHDPLPTDEVVAQAAALYRSGLSVQRVADQVDVAKSTLLKALKAAGVPMRSRTGR